VVRALPDPLLVVARDGKVLLANPAAAEMLPAGTDGVPSAYDLVHPEHRGELESCLATGRATGYPARAWRLAAGAGSWRRMAVQTVRLGFGGPDGPECVLLHAGHLEDGAARPSQESACCPMYDSHTGLASPALFMDRLVQQLLLSRPRSRKVAVLVLHAAEVAELDAAEGPWAGDALAQEMSRRLVGCTRPSDTAAWLGREELAVLLPDVSEEAVDRMSRRIIDRLAETLSVADREVSMLAAVGISLASHDEHDAERVLAEARIALRTARRTAGSVVERYRPGMGAPP
jgi:diguanylate cyclase (GGDEF)-like protein